MTSQSETMTSLVALALLAATLAPPGGFALDGWDKYALVWEDNFNTFNTNNWGFEVSASGMGNGEFQLYTPDPANTFVRDGKLHIKATLLADSRNPATGQPYGQEFMQFGVLNVTALYGSCTSTDNNGCYRTGTANNIPPVLSGRVKSSGKFNFKFGRVVISAKMPVGDWLWPAIWMLPEEPKVYGAWPRSGEIDIVETLGNRDLRCNSGSRGIDHCGCTMHWGVNWDQNRYYLSHREKDDVRNFGDNFHTYILDWSPNGIREYIDNEAQPIMTIPNPQIDSNPNWRGFWEWGKPWNTEVNPWAGGTNYAPFDQPFFFVLNVAVGGTGGFIPEGCTNRGGAAGMQKPWTNSAGYTAGIRNFYNARGFWKPTWDSEGDNNAMQIDYIRVYQGD